MMSIKFNPSSGLIQVKARIIGPKRKYMARLALDTGASQSLLNMAILELVGSRPELSKERVEIITGSGIEYVPKVRLDGFLALGQYRKTFPVLGHTLPPSASVDGLLGLDFFEDQVLHIDFKKGEIELRA